MTDENFEALSQLLGCYFHQDWPDEFEDDAAGIQAIIDFEPKSQIEKAAHEIDFILSSNLSEEELRALLVNAVGCYYEPNSQGINYQQWLRIVRDKFINV
ncbi:hypothetical protein D3C72_2078570 [compost metagenome]